jgi:hypothetical protein
MTRIAFLAASLSLALIGCRGGGGGDDVMGDDQMGSDGGSNAGEVTIQEVQNDAMASGTQLELRGVVITAIDIYGDRTGDVYISEPEGGAFSGVKVFGTPIDTLATLHVGDLVDITNAEKHEACNQAAPCGTVIFRDGASITEVQGVTAGSLTITKVGTGTLPTPAVVDAKAIAQMPTAARLAEWEKWEGVLVSVQNARQLNALTSFDDGDDQKQFSATSGIKIQTSLADLGTDPGTGTCYTSITGIGDFFFDYLVLPRSADDLMTGGTACLPSVTSVAMLQSATTTPELVQLTDVFVTGRDDIPGSNNTGSMGFWVADSLQGAANNGVYVFTGTKPIMDIKLGAKVTFTGTASEFDLGPNATTPASGDTITEINPSVPIVAAQVTAPTAEPTPATSASVETLATIGAAGEPWEGVLVKIGPVKVTNPDLGSSAGHRAELTDNNGKKIQMAKDAFAWAAPTMNACLDVTGLMSVAIFDDLRTVNPRSATDIATSTGTCTP